MEALKTCRACKSENLLLFLPMGEHPPANAFVRETELLKEQQAYSLDTNVCLNCGLIQVVDQLPTGFFENYVYVPSGATGMHQHFAELAQTVTDCASGNLIADIGCNDGLMLMHANELGAKTLGIDPAENIAAIARNRGVNVDVCYFTPQMADRLVEKHGKAGVIVSTNTFHHIGDLHSFMNGISKFLKPEGTFIVEVPWALQIIKLNQFDNIYHEHVSELSVLRFVKLASFFGMSVVDVKKLEVHGGSLRVFMKFLDSGTAPKKSVDEIIDEEKKAGLLDRTTYEKFALEIDALGVNLISMLKNLKSKGKTIAGYGAPAKGNTLLNYFSIGTEYIDYIVDRNPLKHDLYTPGMNIPVRSTDALLENRPDVLLVLAWNFFDEIREQQSAFEKSGGQFLVPLPQPVLLGRS